MRRDLLWPWARKILHTIMLISLISTIQATCLAAVDTSLNEKYPAFNLSSMDLSIHPGDDFHSYVNGKWIENNPVPADKPWYSEFIVVDDRTTERIRMIVEQAANNTSAKDGSVEQKIGLFYRTGLDTATIDRQGLVPLQEELDRIDSITTTADVQRVSDHLLSYYIIRPFFSFFAYPDSKNSQITIAWLSQSGLGLPDRDYYFRQDNESMKTREDYLDHVAKMFVLLGDSPENASRNAKTILRMETRLANSSFTNVENRDAVKTYNRMTLQEIEALAPGFNWRQFLSDLGYPGIEEINVNQPAFVKGLSDMMQTETVDDWKTFLRWKLIRASAPYLGSEFENESFDFIYRKLYGQEQMEPRWKRVLSTESAFLGEPIGQLYVQKYFAPESKAEMEEMASNLKKAFRFRLMNLTWMENSTKARALEKLEAMQVKVGYPDKWQNYTGMVIKNDSYIENVFRAGNFIFNHGAFGLDKVGKPVDRDTWFDPPQDVNAYAYPEMNAIFFPAGILQPPFFNPDADDAINYGAIGFNIGHEIIHGFDDQGRKFDANGNLTDWWTARDSAAFNNSTRILVDQYNKFEALPGLFVNGNLTLGENIADLGGLTVAYYAYQQTLQGEPEKIDGFTGNQRFFLGYAQFRRESIRNESLRTLVLTDVHSPSRFRTNGVVFNMPEFYQAFPEIKPGDKLYRPAEERAAIW
ncbi:Peptidase family M13 [uncultured archaeon]|nr:Peptidase family M13 [uncultured archaeon]